MIPSRTLGQTGLTVSELALGTWGLSGEGYGPVLELECQATIERAIDLGITLFDTSDAYGKGLMEERLGRTLEQVKTPTFVISRQGTCRSSLPPQKRFSPDYLRESVERSIERLKRNSLDVYLLHNPSAETLLRADTLAFVRVLKTSGKIRCWGVSAGSVDVARTALRAGAEVIQLPYNLFLTADLAALGGEIRERGAGLIAHSVLAYGLLSGHWSASRVFAEGDHRRDRWTQEALSKRISQLSAARSLVGGNVYTMRSAAVRFVLSNDQISSAVLGPKSPTQLEQIVREAGSGPPYLDETLLAQLPERLASVGIDTYPTS